MLILSFGTSILSRRYRITAQRADRVFSMSLKMANLMNLRRKTWLPCTLLRSKDTVHLWLSITCPKWIQLPTAL